MRTFSYQIVCISILFFMGCSHTIPGGLVDATAPVSQRGYQILGESEGSASSTFVFGIQTSKADMEVAIREAIDKLGGDELVNVTWDHKRSNYFLFGTYTFIVRGTVVKRTEKWMPITTTIKPRPVSEFGSAEPVFDGLGFALSYSRGTFNEFEFGSVESISGFSSLRLNFYLKNRNALYYFYPQISYAKLSKKGKIKGEISGQPFEFFVDGFIRTIPITLNVGVNGSKIESLQNSLPSNLNPYANFGLGYYFTEFPGDWEWKEFGYNFGLGIEYQLQPNIYLGGGFNRHSVFTGETYTYWDWSLGMSYESSLKTNYQKFSFRLV